MPESMLMREETDTYYLQISILLSYLEQMKQTQKYLIFVTLEKFKFAIECSDIILVGVWSFDFCIEIGMNFIRKIDGYHKHSMWTIWHS